jgi:hypothetical protein
MAVRHTQEQQRCIGLSADHARDLPQRRLTRLGKEGTTMNTITTADVRKAWERYRGRVNWHVLHGRFMVEIPSDVSPYPLPYNLDINAMEATTTRVIIAAESEGWRFADGETYEWWNIIYDGQIIDFEWYEKP